MIAGEVTILVCIVLACSASGLLLARLWRQRQDRNLVKERLSSIMRDSPKAEVNSLLDTTSESGWIQAQSQQYDFLVPLLRMHERSGLGITADQICYLCIALFVSPPLLAFIIDPNYVFVSLIAGLLLSGIPVGVVFLVSEQRRTKFIEQLPDGIELMISVLRGGLSVPQAVKAVGDELPAPCGSEFNQVLHRMNLGQTLPDSIQGAVDRYEVFELDLIRRAAAIQLEVGGSLADLLEKTNATLKQRLQLKRKISVHTAQSRLSGYIIAALPFFVAIAFQVINPNYLKPLYETNVGRVLVCLAITFQVVGVIVIQKLASFRV